jgi:hypothetical protein
MALMPCLLTAQDEQGEKERPELAEILGGIGGFGAPILEGGSMMDVPAIPIGAGGGLHFGSFFLGGYGTAASYDLLGSDMTSRKLSAVQGGLWTGWTPRPHRALHPYLGLRVGRALLELRTTGAAPEAPWQDGVGVTIPEIGTEAILFPWLRMTLCVGYRVVSGVDFPPVGLAPDMLNGFTGCLMLRAGLFP